MPLVDEARVIGAARPAAPLTWRVADVAPEAALTSWGCGR